MASIRKTAQRRRDRRVLVSRSVCFVTGTRAEFGLMRGALQALIETSEITLQIVATGMHLDRSRGRSIEGITDAGWRIDRVVPWRPSNDSTQTQTAVELGRAISRLAEVFDELKSQIVLVVGDRVEAFAAAAAAHVSGRLVAHIHGGDRALGLVDDSLRHAITKLAHVHFPATRQSAARLRRLGEDAWRIHRVGSPGLDGIKGEAAGWNEVLERVPGLRPRAFALLLLHPATVDTGREREMAEMLLTSVREMGFHQIVVIYPNNDPGSAGIAGLWDEISTNAGRAQPAGGADIHFYRDLPRRLFLGLLGQAAVLAGNSSSGIIEAASFATPVLDIGPRQEGRERSRNVIHAPVDAGAIRRALGRIERHRPIHPVTNVYGGGGAGKRIAKALGSLDLDRHRRKLIAG